MDLEVQAAMWNRCQKLEHKEVSIDKKGDDKIWKWLKSFIETLGEAGMSSDESDTEGKWAPLVARVMPWRRSCEKYMDLVDSEHFEGDLFEAKGHLPADRIWRPGSRKSSRKVPKGLPALIYNLTWVNSLDERRKPHVYQLSAEEFTWLFLKWANDP